MEGRKRGNFGRPAKSERPQEMKPTGDACVSAIDSHAVCVGEFQQCMSWSRVSRIENEVHTYIPHGLKTIRTPKTELR